MKQYVEAIAEAARKEVKGLEVAASRHTNQGVEVTGVRDDKAFTILVGPCDERQGVYVVDVSVDQGVAQRRGNGGTTPVDAVLLAQLNTA